MMQFIGTENLPSLDFDEDSGVLIISGRSTSVEKDDFWNPLIEKMDSYLDVPRDITIVIDLEYFNTTSAKSMLDLFNLIATNKPIKTAIATISPYQCIFKNPNSKISGCGLKV